MRKLVIAAAFLLSACAGSTDALVWYQASSVYATVVDNLSAARALGQIDDEAYEQIEVARSCSRTALDRMEEYAFDGVQNNIPWGVTETLNVCLDELIFADTQVQ